MASNFAGVAASRWLPPHRFRPLVLAVLPHWFRVQSFAANAALPRRRRSQRQSLRNLSPHHQHHQHSQRQQPSRSIRSPLLRQSMWSRQRSRARLLLLHLISASLRPLPPSRLRPTWLKSVGLNSTSQRQHDKRQRHQRKQHQCRQQPPQHQRRAAPAHQPPLKNSRARPRRRPAHRCRCRSTNPVPTARS